MVEAVISTVSLFLGRIRHVPVVGDDGQLCGLVSIGDVAKHQLDEIQRDTEATGEYIGRAR